jgi:ABC-type transport system substrate-binding protein
MSSKLSLYDLYEIKKKKDNKLNDAFNIILNLCHKKIKTIAEIGGQSLYYTIPPIIIGYPLYNYSTCMNYIISELKKSGLYVAVLPEPNNNNIYISWKLEDVSEQSIKKRLLLH